jgi:hypothetical protein
MQVLKCVEADTHTHTRLQVLLDGQHQQQIRRFVQISKMHARRRRDAVREHTLLREIDASVAHAQSLSLQIKNLVTLRVCLSTCCE